MTTIEEFLGGILNWVLNLDVEKVGMSFVILLFGTTFMMHMEDNGTSRQYLTGLIGIPLIVLILWVVVWVIL